MSRSTWACELKLIIRYIDKYNTSHAPRERVSWNVYAVSDPCCSAVTLHVSVWVEMFYLREVNYGYKSRSTWACELKLFMKGLWFLWRVVTLHVSVWVEINITLGRRVVLAGHAPRERVSWNQVVIHIRNLKLSHAPRERVSWNPTGVTKLTGVLVTLHVSVWVEISIAL